MAVGCDQVDDRGRPTPVKITGPIYELRAVVTHQGRHENGHFICYRKHARGRTAGSSVDLRKAEAPRSWRAEGARP